MFGTRPVLGLIWAVAALLGAQPAAGQPPVEYIVRLENPRTQMVEMTMIVRGVAGPALEVSLPAWRPGRYVILDPAGTVRDVRARAGDGSALAIQKTDKQTWLIGTGGAGEVVVDYRIFANSLADRTRHVDDTHAFLSPSSVFLYAPSLRDRPLRVRIEAPEGWRVATGLESEGDDPRIRVAPDYDVLVDSPLEIGLHERQEFEVGGVPHEIIVWSGGGPGAAGGRSWEFYADMPRDFAAIVRAQRDVFGDLPYGRYVYIIHQYPGGSGGTEHLNSTVMGASPSALDRRDAYRRFLRLVSHEMFHTWNVKQLRPAGLKPYDWRGENYTGLLWVAEGATSYYDGLTLTRARLMRPDDFLKRLGDGIDALRRRPGAAAQSLEEASFDAWIKFNRPNSDSVNATVSFYDKGSLVSLLLDMEVRRLTENRASLDDVMRGMYRRFPLDGPGYTTADLVRTLDDITQSSFAPFFAAYIAGVEPPPFEEMLAVAGLELKPSSPGERAHLGFTLASRDGLASVATVLADGPAYAAGLLAGDLAVAMNGVRLASGDLEARAKLLSPGDPVRLTILRHDVLREVEFEAGSAARGKWTVRRMSDPTDDQVAVYESWLGRPWAEGPGEEDDEGEK